MEYLSVHGSVQVLATSDNLKSVKEIISKLNQSEIEDGYLSADVVQINRFYIGVYIGAEIVVPFASNALLELRKLGSVIDEKSSITIMQTPDDLRSWEVVLSQ